MALATEQRIVLKVFRPRGRATYRVVCATIEEADATEARYKSSGWCVTRTVREPVATLSKPEKRRRAALRAKQAQVSERVKATRRERNREIMRVLADKLASEGLMNCAAAAKAAQKLDRKAYVTANVGMADRSDDDAVCQISVGDIRGVAGLQFNVIRHRVEAPTFEAALDMLRSKIELARTRAAAKETGT